MTRRNRPGAQGAPNPKVTKRRILQTAGAVTAIAIGLLAAYIITYDPARDQEPNLYNVSAAGQPALLVEYADFNCPHCANFALTAMPEIKRAFIETGKLQYQYRHYPFITETSITAAEAAECARDQGRFQQFHDSTYRIAITRTEPLTADAITSAALTAGTDLQEMQACLAAGKHRETVENHAEMGRRDGVRGTPTVLLEGEVLHWEDWPHLRRLIEAGIERKDLETR